ncbi:MAG: MFS transporter [Deltaproteobacteria bacterium]
MTPDAPTGSWIESDVPSRLDALGWSHWHRRVILALGITWILDGLEASLISNLGPTIEKTTSWTNAEVGASNTAYLIGEVAGALVFGHLTDRLGRKKLFLVTLALYLVATALSGAAPWYALFVPLRFFAGAGIGGEYSAINSAIDELVPARIRGRVDLAINGSYWIGVGFGAILTVSFLHASFLPEHIAWRATFGLGAVLGAAILLVRRNVPESPRWLLMHGYTQEASRTVGRIEDEIRASGIAVAEGIAPIRIRVSGTVSLRYLAHMLVRVFPRRTVLGVSLLLAQAFLYNSIFFSYGMILTKFHGVAADDVGWFMLPFAVGNFLGPALLGRYFDHWGRRVMIPATYALSGVLLVVTGALFWAGKLDATTQTIAWSVVFFFASAAASSAYLTVSELFPVEIRGMAIATFFAFATLVGSAAPLLFGRIVDAGSPAQLFAGYALSAGLMIGAAVIARWLGVAAEGRSLEALAASHHHDDAGAE